MSNEYGDPRHWWLTAAAGVRRRFRIRPISGLQVEQTSQSQASKIREGNNKKGQGRVKRRRKQNTIRAEVKIQDVAYFKTKVALKSDENKKGDII